MQVFSTFDGILYSSYQLNFTCSELKYETFPFKLK